MASSGMQGGTALQFAAAGGHATVIKVLLAHNADVHAKDHQVSLWFAFPHTAVMLCLHNM